MSLAALAAYPFPRVDSLLDAIEPQQPPIVMTLGEPRHSRPNFVNAVLAQHVEGYRKYPPVNATLELRASTAGWLWWMTNHAWKRGSIDLPDVSDATCVSAAAPLYRVEI